MGKKFVVQCSVFFHLPSVKEAEGELGARHLKMYESCVVEWFGGSVVERFSCSMK